MTTNGGDAVQPQRRSRLADLADSTVVPAAAEAVPATSPEDKIIAARRRFAVILGEFRRTAVLVPLDERGSLWSADQNGVRWILAFSNEETLAEFARAQGGAGQEWEYQRVLGARLLDALVPMLGVPAGVALDTASADGMLFPPVAGVVPDAVAVDLEADVHVSGGGGA